VGEYMPKSVEDVKFINDCGLLKVEFPGSGVGCRKRAMLASCAGAGVGGDEFSLGGVGVVRLRSKGLRGTGRMRGGPSSAIVRVGLKSEEIFITIQVVRKDSTK
jgi:hypothetical protein